MASMLTLCLAMGPVQLELLLAVRISFIFYIASFELYIVSDEEIHAPQLEG